MDAGTPSLGFSLTTIFATMLPFLYFRQRFLATCLAVLTCAEIYLQLYGARFSLWVAGGIDACLLMGVINTVNNIYTGGWRWDPQEEFNTFLRGWVGGGLCVVASLAIGGSLTTWSLQPLVSSLLLAAIFFAATLAITLATNAVTAFSVQPPARITLETPAQPA